MPDERSTSETPAASGPAKTTPDTPAPSGSAPETKPASGPGNEPTVPASRLREETGKRRRLEQQLAALQGQLAEANKPKEPEKVPEGRRFKDDYRERLFRELGGDDDAYNAVRMMDEHAEHVTKERGYVSREEVEGIVNGRVMQTEQRQNAVYRAQNRVNTWIERGIVPDSEAKQIFANVVEKIKELRPEHVNPTNIDFLLSGEFATAVESGNVKPWSSPAPSPLQPSSRNGGPAPEPEDFDRSSSKVRGLRGLDPEIVKRARAMSMKNHAAATGGR